MSVAAAAHPLLLDPGYATLKQHLIESTGLAYYADKDRDLAARIGARLAVLSLNGCGSYLDLLQDRAAGESERHLLIGQLTIGETYFFRHTEQFDGLRDVAIPDLIERNRERRTLRIWSAGCATGAEPYTLAILLKQHFADRLAGWDVQILGTDINQTFLARAARGEFDERALRSTPDEVKRQWFSPSGTSWIVRPFLREWVSFQYHNLVEHPYPSVIHGIAALDLILCRNVMIYFDWDVIARILDRFHECLVDGGWLAVGHAESNPDVFRPYRTVSVPGATLYQKNGVCRPDAPFQPPVPAAHPLPWLVPVDMQTSWAPPALPAIPHSPLSDPYEQPPEAARSGLARVRQLGDEGRWVDAANACAPLLDRDRLDPNLHFYHALILEQMRDHGGAEQAFRRAIYLDRAFALAHYHLALLLAKTERRESAQHSLRNVQRLLASLDGNQQIAEADGLTVGDLAQLAELQLSVWQK